MSRFLARIRGLFKSRTQVGIDKAGNQYFIRNEEEMMELEARRERVKLNIASKVGPPDLESFIKQFRGASLDPGSGTQIQQILKLLRRKLRGCQCLQNQLVVASPLSQERGNHHHEEPFQSVWLINLQLTVRPLYHRTPCDLTS
ncbi:hypothetical protein EJ110_NYTH01068 [Nymphaea thermarum]|nr:hypothetical protein EJ110_NYTH01068 [Nymphaea thermarum]